jgi:polyisoprenyl-phosphate glycosyltransferase
MLVVVVLSAIQMFVLGMIGEYLGRLYIEAKRRPLYLIADVAGTPGSRATLGFQATDPQGCFDIKAHKLSEAR